MFRLLLIRHAKSSWKDSTLADIDRPLNARGERDVPEMARRLVQYNEQVDLVISSPALRAKAIAKPMATHLNAPLHIMDELYTFSFRKLMSALQTLPDKKKIAIVTHNPAITEVVNYLTRQPIANVPTSGVVAMDCHIGYWSELGEASCQLDYFDYPKKRH